MAIFLYNLVQYNHVNSGDLFYVKSLEEDFCTKTIRNNNKVNFQLLGDVIKTSTIKQKRRLSTTILSEDYLKTYRLLGNYEN